jgi:hypothetical protein
MICAYHEGDFDGQCSAAIVQRIHPGARLIPMDYEKPFPWGEITPLDPVCMVDFSLPIPDMILLQRCCKELTWIDHHKTAIDAAAQQGFFPNGRREVGKAACELAWEYSFPKEPMPAAVFLLGRYDVFDLEADSRVMDFQFGLRAYPTKPEDPANPWKVLLRPGYVGLVDELCNLGHFIRQYQRTQDEKSMARFSYWTSFEGLSALVINRTGGSHQFEADPRHKDAALLLSYSRLPNDKWLVNLYTFQDVIDCGAIAKRYGGGGHQKAAGFITQNLPF